MTDDKVKQQIRTARGKFLAMAGTYSLGVFNDSFFREAAMLLAVAANEEVMSNVIMALFSLPYILFASYSGWLADRFSKRHVVIGAKVLELVAMIMGAIGIITGSYPFILTMVFLMAWQSCIFSPSLNGSIPELYPDVYVTKANARLKVATTAAILGGIAVVGHVLVAEGTGWGGVPMGRLLVGICVVGIAALGVLVSFGVPKRPAADAKARFPWEGPWSTIRQLTLIYRDRLLRMIVIVDLYIWFVGTLLVLIIKVLAMKQYGYDKDMASSMMAVWVIGVAVGGLIGGAVAVGKRWFRYIPVCALAMGLTFLAVGAVPWMSSTSLEVPAMLFWNAFAVPVQIVAIFVLLGVVAVFGGMVLIPCEAFVQRRPQAQRKGQVIASVNFLVFAGMMVSCLVGWLLRLVLTPTGCFAAVGVVTLPVAAWLWWGLRRESDDA